jgi:lipopolysaccharide transport system permease protein
MLIPLIGFILGIPILTYAVFCYTGIVIFRQIPQAKKQKGNLPLAIGLGLIGIALMLGITGYFSPINGNLVRYVRIIIGTAGLLLTGYQVGVIWFTSKSFKNLIKRLKQYIKLQLQALLQTMLGFVRKAGKLGRRLPVNEQWWAKFDLLRTLVRRDLEARYKGSILGNFWPLLNQLSQLLIYTYVFSIVLKVKLSNFKGLPENHFTFGFWLFAGLLPWIAFTGGLMQSAGSVVGQPNLVKKVVFPLALLPLVPILSTFIESSFGLMALIFLVAISSHTLHPTLALLPLVWLTQLLLTAGLGYLTAGLTVFLRDIPQTLTVTLNLWLYLTPIVYPATAIPEQFKSWVFWLNPMTAIAEVYRDLVLAGEVTHWGEWAVASLISIVIFICGFSVYRRLRPAFADVL